MIIDTLNKILDSLGSIDFTKTVGLEQGEKLLNKHYQIVTVDRVIEAASIAGNSIQFINGIPYIYTGMFWDKLEFDDLIVFLNDASRRLGVGKYISKYFSFKDALLKQFVSELLKTRISKVNRVMINLQNGILHISSNGFSLEPHDPKFLLTHLLPFDFNQVASAPVFRRFLDRVLPDLSAQNLLAEYCGYIFLKHSQLKLEKVLILYGEGANGKSVFFEVIRALLGYSVNVSEYSIKSLTEDNGYCRAMISGKLLNYGSEIGERLNLDAFKRLASGEPMEARLPYGNPMIIDDWPKLIFNCNQMPRVQESSGAFIRRLIPLHFAVTIPEHERDPTFANQIIDHELPGVLNWIIEGLSRLQINKGFTKVKSVDDFLKSYSLETDCVKGFIEVGGFTPDLCSTMLLSDVFNEFNVFCSSNGYRGFTKREFSGRLINLGFKEKRSAAGMCFCMSRILLELPTLSTQSTLAS